MSGFLLTLFDGKVIRTRFVTSISKEAKILSSAVETVTKLVTPILEDPSPQAYFLEVSSPGAERPLKKESDYEQAVGKYIHISLYQAVDGEKQIEGTLVHLDSEQLTLSVKIKTRVKEMTFERKNIAKARLAIQF